MLCGGKGEKSERAKGYEDKLFLPKMKKKQVGEFSTARLSPYSLHITSFSIKRKASKILR